jgi:hypothetical protein
MEDLRIGWVPDDQRIGLTRVPGYPMKGKNGKPVARDLDADLERVTRDVAHLVVLLTNAELAAVGLDELVERALRHGLAVVRRPVIAGRSVPGWLMTEIASWRHYGPTVYADISGRGRAAVAAAWALVADGASVPNAMGRVQAGRGPKALATDADRQRVIEFWRHRDSLDDYKDEWFLLPTAGLRRAHLPPPRAPWQPHLNLFAISFDGYTFAGGVNELVAFARRHEGAFREEGHLSQGLTIDEARSCLFWVQRVWHSNISDPTIGLDPGPSANELLFAWALVERLRELISRP